jgi:hypothetical protein
VIRAKYESSGSIEGQLEVVSSQGGIVRCDVYDRLLMRAVRCDVPQRLRKDVLDLFDRDPDFVVRLKAESEVNLVLETKGFDPLEQVKAQAARRWTEAVNGDGRFGRWAFEIVHKPEDIRTLLDRL